MKKRIVLYFIGFILLLLMFFGGYMFYLMKQMLPIETGKINNELYAGKNGFVNFFIYKDGEDCVAFDAGVKEELVLAAMEELKLNPEIVSHVFLTHSDGDHVGGLKAFSKARVLLPENEVALLDGRAERKVFFMKGGNDLPVEDYSTISDGQEFKIGNIKIKGIHAPGHTPGSMVYVVNDSILIMGDVAEFSKTGELKPIFKAINNDYEMALETVEKLKRMDISLLVTAHDGYKRLK